MSSNKSIDPFFIEKSGGHSTSLNLVDWGIFQIVYICLNKGGLLRSCLLI